MLKVTRSFLILAVGVGAAFPTLAAAQPSNAAGAVFLTMHAWSLDREELDGLAKRLNDGEYSSEEDLEEARWLKTYIGKTGFLQLGWAHQGCMFVYELGTEWYDHYQRLRELSDDVGGFMIDEPDQDDQAEEHDHSGDN